MQGKGEPLPLQPIPKTKNNNKTKTNNKIKVVYTEDWTHPAGPTTFVWGQSAKPTVRSISMPAGGCVGGYATNTMKRGRDTRGSRRRLFTLCMAWSSYRTG